MTNLTAQIKTPVLKSMLLCAATKDVRDYLKGIHAHTTGRTLRLESSDGHTLTTSTSVDAHSAEFDVIIPREAIEIAIKAYPKSDEFTLCREDENWSLAGIGFSPIEGKYPDCKRVWPDKTDGKPCLINPEYFGRVGKMAKFQKLYNASIRLWWAETMVVFEIGEVRGVIMALRTDAVPSTRVDF